MSRVLCSSSHELRFVDQIGREHKGTMRNFLNCWTYYWDRHTTLLGHRLQCRQAHRVLCTCHRPVGGQLEAPRRAVCVEKVSSLCYTLRIQDQLVQLNSSNSTGEAVIRLNHVKSVFKGICRKAIPKDMPMMPAAPQGVTRGVVWMPGKDWWLVIGEQTRLVTFLWISDFA